MVRRSLVNGWRSSGKILAIEYIPTIALWVLKRYYEGEMSTLLLLLSAFGIVFGAGVALMIYGILTAPIAYEDELGFHPQEKCADVSDRDVITEGVVISSESL